MKDLEEAIIFYESQLPKEIVEKCKAETQDKMSHVDMLIEKYKGIPNYNHNKLNKINDEEK
jgi:bacterioferritin (cytochrome b1)